MDPSGVRTDQVAVESECEEVAHSVGGMTLDDSHNNETVHKKKHNKSDTEDSKGNRNDHSDDQNKKKKKKKKKKKRADDTSQSEGEGDETDRRHRKHKKRKKKKRAEDTSQSEGEGDDSDRRHRKHKKKKKRKKKDRSGDETAEDSQTENEANAAARKRPDGPVLEKRAARRPGNKLEPEEWTREDLMEKLSRFGTYEIDRSTGCGTVRVEGKRLLQDEVAILVELFRRNTEIQVITFKKCFMTDETLASLCEEAFFGLRHVKRLALPQNALTRESTHMIIKTFASRVRGLQSLDLRDNIMNAEDSRLLFKAFPAIQYLNGVNLTPLKQDSEDKSYSAADKKMTITEISIICCILERYIYLDTIDLSKNFINSECLHMLAATLEPLRNIKNINLRLNPLTNDGEDNTGVLAIMRMLKKNKCILYMDITGCKVPTKIADDIERSLMVNRSVEASVRGNRFMLYIENRIAAGAPPPPRTYFHGWTPSLKLDDTFLNSKQNAAKNMDVVVEGDHIILPRGIGGKRAGASRS